MNKQAKRTLIEGLVLLVLLGGAMVVYLNWSYSRVKSNRAQVTVSTYSVGTEYAGEITKQDVTVGTTVQAGQPLFTLKSTELAEALKNNQIDSSSLPFKTDKDGNMVITANKAGLVRQINATQGSFVAADKQIATIADSSTIGVTADFTLSSRQLGQVTPSTLLVVKLPSGRQVSGRITTVLQSSQGGRMVTTVQANLPAGSVDQLNSAGTPVNVALVFSQSTYYHQLVGYTQNLMARWIKK